MTKDRRLLAALGLRLRELREQRGLTQQDVAVRADLSRQYLVGLEAGRRNPSLLLLRRIAEELRTNLDELFRDLI